MSSLSISPVTTLATLLAEQAAPVQGVHQATALEKILTELQPNRPAEVEHSANAQQNFNLDTGSSATAGLMFLNVGAGHAVAIENPQVLKPDALADNPQTLHEMAQTVPRHDIATQRHGPSANNPQSPSSTREVESNAHATAGNSSSRPDGAGANPLEHQVKITPEAALFLHTQNTEFRSTLSKFDPTKEAKKKREEKDDGTNSPEDEDLTPQKITPDEEPEKPATPHAGNAQAPSTLGDAQLYQNTVAALKAVGALAGPTFELLAELRCQRRVVIVTPHGLRRTQGHGLRCEAHVDLLWPVPGGGTAMRLRGEIVWAQAKLEADWFITHLVKSQSAGGVRQLSPTANQANSRQIAVCLGAQALPMVAWSHACVRVHEGTRLWQALEPQWSLRLAVSTLPLVWHQSPHGARHGA